MTADRARFITLEGPEGSGKTTQLSLLAEWLRGQGADVLTTMEPGGEPAAEQIRRILLEDKAPLSLECELLLYLAARAQHVSRVIGPALESGKTVICARFSDSTLAYQGYARGLDMDFILAANSYATGGLTPDLTLLIDAPVEMGLQRQMERNRMEEESLEFHRKVREGFLKIAEKEPKRVIIIDGTADVESVHRAIVSVVKGRVAG